MSSICCSFPNKFDSISVAFHLPISFCRTAIVCFVLLRECFKTIGNCLMIWSEIWFKVLLAALLSGIPTFTWRGFHPQILADLIFFYLFFLFSRLKLKTLKSLFYLSHGLFDLKKISALFSYPFLIHQN